MGNSRRKVEKELDQESNSRFRIGRGGRADAVSIVSGGTDFVLMLSMMQPSGSEPRRVTGPQRRSK